MSSSRADPTPLTGARSDPPRRTGIRIPQDSCVRQGDRTSTAIPELHKVLYGTDTAGISLAELIHSSEEDLREMIPDYDDKTVQKVKVRDSMIRIKIYWPGYEYLDSTHFVYLSQCPDDGGLSCKGELAVQAAYAYSKFLEEAPKLKHYGGLYCHSSFKITRDGPFRLDNLALVSVNNVFGGVFQAFVELIDPYSANIPEFLPPTRADQKESFEATIEKVRRMCAGL